jgi:hypothetical protein
MLFTGHQAFLDRHEEVFKGMFRGTGAPSGRRFAQVRPPRGRRCGTLTSISEFFRIGSVTRRAPRWQGTPAHSAPAGGGERGR